MTDGMLNSATVLQHTAAQLRADGHAQLAASLEQFGTYLSPQAAAQTEAILVGGQADDALRTQH